MIIVTAVDRSRGRRCRTCSGAVSILACRCAVTPSPPQKMAPAQGRGQDEQGGFTSGRRECRLTNEGLAHKVARSLDKQVPPADHAEAIDHAAAFLEWDDVNGGHS